MDFLNFAYILVHVTLNRQSEEPMGAPRRNATVECGSCERSDFLCKLKVSLVLPGVKIEAQIFIKSIQPSRMMTKCRLMCFVCQKTGEKRQFSP